MPKRGVKKGLSTVIITLIIILVSLVAIALIWAAVRNVINKGSEQVSMGQFTMDASVEVIGINETRNNVSLIVTRNPGIGEFTGVSFLFENITGKEIVEKHFTLYELEAKGFELHLEILGVSNLTKLSIYPLYRTSSNEFTMGAKTDEYIFTGIEKFLFRPGGGAICGNNIKELWEGCDGTDWGGVVNCTNLGYISGSLTCNPPGDARECRFNTDNCVSCVPNCAGKVCGDDGCGGRCPPDNCGTGICDSNGQCVSSCTPLAANYCSANGYECGTFANGTCSGNVLCGAYSGGCQSGYTCNASYKCVAASGGITYLCGTDGIDNSCTPAIMTSLIASASNGDTIRIANGVHAFSSIINVNKPITISGSGLCTNCGDTATPSGTWPTTVTKSDGTSVFRVGGWSGLGTVRITGIHFSGAWGQQYDWNNFGAVYTFSTDDVGQGTERLNVFRVDNNYFTGTAMTAFGNQGGYGLVDHNYFQDSSHGQMTLWVMQGGYWGSSWGRQYSSEAGSGYPGGGGYRWSQPAQWGSAYFVFFEDNTVVQGGGEGNFPVVDGQGGGRYVFRHNYVVNGLVEVHGTESGGTERSGRAYEVYNNYFVFSGGSHQSALYWRGGETLAHDNEFGNGYQAILKIVLNRVGCGGGFQCPTPFPSGCTSAYGGPQNWDGNLGGAYPEGYPCLDQVGRGQATSVNAQASPYGQPQAAGLARVWNVILSGNSPTGTCSGTSQESGQVCNTVPTYLIDGRDYCYSVDNECAYSYTPYTYPHPLTLIP